MSSGIYKWTNKETGHIYILKIVFKIYVGFCASEIVQKGDSDCPTRKFFQNFFLQKLCHNIFVS
jgi:hypothetical protein